MTLLTPQNLCQKYPHELDLFSFWNLDLLVNIRPNTDLSLSHHSVLSSQWETMVYWSRLWCHLWATQFEHHSFWFLPCTTVVNFPNPWWRIFFKIFHLSNGLRVIQFQVFRSSYCQSTAPSWNFVWKPIKTPKHNQDQFNR